MKFAIAGCWLALGSALWADEFVYVSPNGPQRLALAVRVAGQPPEVKWSATVGLLFAFSDRSGDGKLDANERALWSAGSGRTRSRTGLEAAGIDLVGKLKFDAKSEMIDRAAFEQSLRTAGYGPLTIRVVAPRNDSLELTNSLFKHLDRDRNQHLSLAELADARKQLIALDVNEDDWLTTAELLGRAVSAANRAVLPRPSVSDESDASSADWFVLHSATAVKELLAARGKPKATTLVRSELNMPEAAFRSFDRDANGKLDGDELAAWLREAPHATANIDCAKPTPATTLTLDGAQFLLPTPAAPPNVEALLVPLRMAFQSLAKDGVVDKKLLKDQPAPTALFDFADRNADSQLTKAEFDAMAELLLALSQFQAEVVVVDQGRGLFELLDANGDGQLSLRELASASTILKPYVDARGNVTRESVPRLFPIRAGFRNMLGNVEVPMLAASMPAAPRAKPPQDVPSWFLHMDRNGDGDVSLREFLGPLEQFRTLDRNGDALISPEEAKRL